MDDFINVIKKDPQVQIKIIDTLDRYNRLDYNNQSKIEYDTLIQNLSLIEMINVMATTIVNTDIELKMKIFRIECLEGRIL